MSDDLPTVETTLTGWGRTGPSRALVHTPADDDEVAAAVAAPGDRGVIARGCGRSYGDAAQNAGGRVLDTTVLDRIHRFDPQSGVVVADAGLTLDTLMRFSVPRGWFPAVTPGTRQVTLGGAIAADVHGKNHHVDGTFTAAVTRMVLHTPTGRRWLTRTSDADAFHATVGGMGLTGVIDTVELQLRPVETPLMRVDTRRAGNLDELMDRLAAADRTARYSVAWVDAMARGRRLGRGVVTCGDHARADDLDRPAPAYAPRQLASVPDVVPPGLLNPWTVRAFNEAWFRKAPACRVGQLQPIPTFFHPLDGVGDWNRLYGPAGFVQYQYVVPDGAEHVVAWTLERLADARVASFLAVLKRFGAANDAPLSFPRPGWTLAVDLPVGDPRLPAVIDRFDEVVADAGGRVYLAKDARLRPELVEAMYPRLAAWRATADRLDPDRRLQSDLSRRLRLRGA